MRVGARSPSPDPVTCRRHRRRGMTTLRLLGLMALTGAALVVKGAPASAQAPTASFEIQGERYDFDRVICSLPETADGDLGVMARQDGLELNISRDAATGPTVSLYDHENPMSPSVSWEAPDPTMMPSQRRSLELIRTDGRRLTVEATFTNEHTGATADGSVVVDCSSEPDR